MKLQEMRFCFADHRGELFLSLCYNFYRFLLDIVELALDDVIHVDLICNQEGKSYNL